MNASGENKKTSDYVYVKELKKDEPAPFHGALLPKQTLYDYEANTLELRYCQPTLLTCQQDLVDSQKKDNSGVAWFFAGIASGVLASLMIYRK